MAAHCKKQKPLNCFSCSKAPANDGYGSGRLITSVASMDSQAGITFLLLSLLAAALFSPAVSGVVLETVGLSGIEGNQMIR